MSERKRAYISETDYARAMAEKVLPYLNARRFDGYFSGYDGNALHYVKYGVNAAGGEERSDTRNAAGDAVQKAVIISHGFTESAEKWREIAYYFLREGYNVYIPEHRGHGLSYRKTADKTLTHIDRFAEYVDDFEIFCAKVRAEESGEIYLYAHSMGCAIGMLYMERAPEFFAKAFLSSPMIVPNSGKVPLWIARAIMKTAVIFGKSAKRAFISSPYPGDEKFEDSARTSRARFEDYNRFKRTHEDYQNYCSSYGWVYNSLTVGKKILKKGAAERVQTPVFIAAAEYDTLVLGKPQIALSKRLKHCEFKVFAGAKHEIYGSADGVAFGYFDTLFDFFRGEAKR